jgi:hypothetical protein
MAAVTSGTLSAEEKAKAIVEIQKQQAKEQWQQGPGAVAAAASQPGGMAAGQITKMSDEQSNKMAGYLEGTHNLQNLHTLFDQMATNTVGAGGAIRSGLGLLTPLTNISSPQARTYHAYVESSLIPLAKGLMGDAATTAGRPDVSAKMEEALPTNGDNQQTGGQKSFMMLDRNINNLKTERDIMRQKGIDTSPIDGQILDAQKYYDSPEVQKYNPLKTQPVVQAGTSDQANATVANVNSGANAGVQAPSVAGNQSGSTLNSQPQAAQQPTQPAQAAPTPSLEEQHQQAVEAAKNFYPQEALHIGTGVSKAAGAVSGVVGSGIGWLQSLLPENWNPDAFQSGPPSQGTTGSY